MDHVIDYISEYMEFDVNELREEFKSKKYTKLSDCPSYPDVKAYCEAKNILIKARYNKDDAVNYIVTPKILVADLIEQD